MAGEKCPPGIILPGTVLRNEVFAAAGSDIEDYFDLTMSSYDSLF